jgi:hypothetical protein
MMSLKLIIPDMVISIYKNIMLDEKGYRYLYHILKRENMESVLSHKMLYSEADRYKHKIVVDGVYSTTTFNFKKPWSVDPGQYPGLYMSLMDCLPDLGKEEIALVFPSELLARQTNWHFNLFDRNGTFGYDTYTHDSIHLVPDLKDVKNFYMEKIGRYHNEVVFHDSIDMKNCSFVYDGTELYSIADYSHGNITHELSVDERPGAFLYYSDRWYTGMKVPYYSLPEMSTTSVDFYRDYVKRYVKCDAELILNLNNATTKRAIEILVENIFTSMYLER